MSQSKERQEPEKRELNGQAPSVSEGEIPPSDTDGGADKSRADWAFLCLVTAARVLGIPADYNQLVRAYPPGDYSELRLLRAAKGLSLKAKKTTGNTDRLDRMPLPALAFMRDGNVKLLIKSSPEKLLIYDPNQSGDEKSAPRPVIVETAKFREHWSGEAILLARKFTFSAVGEKFGITWFLPVMGRFKRLFGEVFTASFFLQSFGLITPLFSQVIIDKVLVHKGLSTLDILVAGIFIINTFEWLLGFLRSYLFSHTTNRVDVILGTKLYKHLLALPLPFFEMRRVGEVIARVRELDTVRQFITGTALTVVLDILFSVVFIAVMFFYSIKLTFVALAAVPCFALLSIVVTPILRERLKKKFQCNAESHSYMVESVTGIGTVKSLAVEPQLNQKWESLLANYVTASFKAGILSTFGSGMAHFIQKTSTLAILWVGAREVIAGRMSVGQLIAFQMLSGRVAEPVLRLASLWQDFQQVRLSLERLGDVLNFPAEPDVSPGRTTLGTIRGEVRIENLTFRYRLDSPPVLEDVNLIVPPGTTVGIVGRSGSGKSTLTKLIQRLYIAERGRILIDGVDSTNVDPAWLRRQIGVVLQENFLFNGSVRENIATVEPGAPMDKVIAAAKMAGAHEFISELPEGYDTPVGERGTALSGGQRQRVAIAKALLANPRILIFDEATSALDYYSERAIQENMRYIRKDRTLFVIAHRLSTVRDADVIVVIEKGKILERGTHEELMKNAEGIYHGLYRVQSGESGSRMERIA
jgi:subfamily B ATP-binding cassette protein HlyB/CyaB